MNGFAETFCRYIALEGFNDTSERVLFGNCTEISCQYSKVLFRSITASVIILATLFASLFSGLIMDNIGRLNTIKIAGVPGVLGWSIIAVAKNFSWIMVGRVFVGMAAGKDQYQIG